jgi:hypothetical protein
VTPDSRETLILKFAADRVIAHQSLFVDRHADATPPFHDDLTELWHSSAPKVLTLAFRGGGKSTLAEEALVLAAAMKLVRNVLIIGSNSDRANDRLRAIKHELETNELLVELYGDLRGPVWNEGRIVLANGVCIQAFGRGQALRGVKHHDARPDLCFADDLEEEEHVRSPEARQETLRWFMTELVPALDDHARLRVAATPLDREALPMVLARQSGWITKTYPIEYIDPQGVRRATWPSRFPLKWIDEKREEFQSLGLQAEFSQEYLCLPEDPASKVFLPSMIQLRPRTRTYEPVFVCYDPARTVKAGSAMTGWAVWSPVGKRLIVWDGGAEFWKPDEIIEHIFKVHDEYSPVVIGVEVNGLEEFILQPLRQEQLRRGIVLPVIGLRAPKGKLQFIAGLQPFLQSGDITFAKDLSALKQFCGFPTGKIDFPNALAYALKLRPDVTYENFSMHNVVETLSAQGGSPVYLCLNATRTVTTAVAVQFVAQALHVLGDWIREREPGAVVGEIIRDASIQIGKPLVLRAGPSHFERYDTVGLRGAVARVPAELRSGGSIDKGRAELRSLLLRQIRGEPALRVSSEASWTLRAFAAGHARDGFKLATVGDDIYQLLMEGLESLVGTAQFTADPHRRRYAIARDGRRYITSSPHLAEPNLPTKDRWWEDVEADRPQSILPLGHPLRR